MKYITFLISALILLGISKSTAQKISPCLGYDPNRTMEGFQKIILDAKDPFIRNELWPEYAKLGNQILQTSKLPQVRQLVLRADLRSMTWLLNHSTVYDQSFYDGQNYYNGGRSQNKLVYTSSLGLRSDWVGLRYEDVEDIYAKIACGNPEDPKNYTPYVAPPVIAPRLLCENRLKLIIHKFVDEKNNSTKPDYSELIGTISTTCKNVVDTTTVIEKVLTEKKVVIEEEKEEQRPLPPLGMNPPLTYSNNPNPAPTVKVKKETNFTLVIAGVTFGGRNQPQPWPRQGGPVWSPPHNTGGPVGAPGHWGVVNGQPVWVPGH